MLRITNLSFGYGETLLVEDLSFEAHPGEITVIAAPSGRGKTSLLKAINRLHEVEESPFWQTGTIEARVDGALRDLYDPALDVHALRRQVAYIFQSPTVLPMSIAANVAFGLRLAGERDREQIAERVRSALEAAGLYDEVRSRLDAPASILSQGQKQRLAIARALILDPTVLLLDEPTASLDPAATGRIEALLLQLKEKRTLLLVSHDEGQVKRIGERIIELGGEE